MQAKAQIFLCYARLDRGKVECLYQQLSSEGFNPWMDKKEILPGERWESSIQKAIRCSDFFLVCLSKNSANRRGFIQKEIKDALEIWREKLDSDIYLIPVKLEECDVPESLRHLQWVDLFENDGWDRLVRAIQVGMDRKSQTVEKEPEPSGVQRHDAVSNKWHPVQSVKLCQLLVKQFDQEEFRTLCFNLSVDYDSLRGEGKEGKARELIAYLERRDRIPELVRVCRELRPNVQWEEILEASQEVSAADLPSSAVVEPEPSSETKCWQPGCVLDGRYRVIKLLITTDRCEIYKAQEVRGLGQTVVIKRLKSEKTKDKDACERFRREAMILRYIHEPSVLPVYDIKIEDDECYFAAEFADMGTLGDYLKTLPNHKLKPVEAFQIARSVCQGLKAAHALSIIHRDVKPGNIYLFSQRSGGVLAKLADFNIAHVPKEFSDEPRTEIGAFMGTPFYTSPEQLNGDAADARSDLYSWAIVFFEMLTGEHPTESLLRKERPHPPRLDEFPLQFFSEKGIPSDIASVLHKSLRTDLQLRYRSAEQVLETLEAITPPAVADINRHLNDGVAYARSENWSASYAEFELGIELCKWYGDLNQLPDDVGQLVDKLQIGQLCVRGMIHMAKRQWQEAVEILKPLGTLGSKFLGIDVAAQVELAQLQQQYEDQLRLVRELKEQKKWAEVLKEINKLEEINKLLATHRGIQ